MKSRIYACMESPKVYGIKPKGLYKNGIKPNGLYGKGGKYASGFIQKI